MIVISRADAQLAGLTRYFTGQPCKRGHVAERLVSIRQCIGCAAVYHKADGQRHRAKRSASRLKWAAENREYMRPIRNAWNAKHKDAQARRSRKWYLANKTQADAASKAWIAANPSKVNARAARFRAELLQRIPQWADHELIENVYAIAKACRNAGVEVDVDHIIPLRGKTVSGLHVHDNLQILPSLDNKRKSNHLLLH